MKKSLRDLFQSQHLLLHKDCDIDYRNLKAFQRAINKRCRDHFFKSAEKIANQWHIDEDEYFSKNHAFLQYFETSNYAPVGSENDALESDNYQSKKTTVSKLAAWLVYVVLLLSFGLILGPNAAIIYYIVLFFALLLFVFHFDAIWNEHKSILENDHTWTWVVCLTLFTINTALILYIKERDKEHFLKQEKEEKYWNCREARGSLSRDILSGTDIDIQRSIRKFDAECN
ncbi:hypothetical protein [Thalassobacter stenotrophicus]|uniref:Uncharacterized protein n=2 Tax=Thalassobacter stenotrophicus TaxID=266809 RepID=A0A0P1EXU5_9RHOB|nr:hypothetical protein [Thalassobacter stenotrophicus]CUH59851.1 hypothetical protein THS5294_01139 [Thalassobacter stenotrophicus]SHJ15801.1 hypothetical protein SAMN02744035_02769 [Thalassobacter stenotrophicus DSM 16310]